MSARPGPRGGYHAQWYPYRDHKASKLNLSAMEEINEERSWRR
jgi:hypothetical protein